MTEWEREWVRKRDGSKSSGCLQGMIQNIKQLTVGITDNDQYAPDRDLDCNWHSSWIQHKSGVKSFTLIFMNQESKHERRLKLWEDVVLQIPNGKLGQCSGKALAHAFFFLIQSDRTTLIPPPPNLDIKPLSPMSERFTTSLLRVSR